VRAHLALLVEAQLFAQEEVLSGECRLGLKGTAQKLKNIHSDVTNGERWVREAST
jgi:hypothetical protein